MRKYVIPLLLLAFLFVGLPLIVAMREVQSVRHHYGRLNNEHQIECIAVDKTHRQQYRCLIFSQQSASRVTCWDGVIALDGTPLQFPKHKNVAVLSPTNDLRFLRVSFDEIEAGSSESGVGFIGGYIPRFKDYQFGPPASEFVSTAIAGW